MPLCMRADLKDIIALFSRLGITAFGGPAAHIAMMRHEVVTKRGWMDDRLFLRLMGATNLIPGPNSTEMAIHIGKEKAGWKGLVAAGLLFIIPAVLITGVIAWAYKTYGSLPEVTPFLYGIRPAIIAIIAFAVWPLAKAASKNKTLIATGIACLALSLLGMHEALLIFGAGLVYAVFAGRGSKVFSFFPILAIGGTMGNSGLFFTFLKIGAILYGSGYALFAYIDTELVTTGILSKQQLMDAVAIGQFTPGPVFSSVTFIGYQINGVGGAIAATIGVFLPSFIFVALLGRIMKWLGDSPFFNAFLDAANIASVAVIASVCIKMGGEALDAWPAILILAASALLLWLFPKINSALLVVFGAAAGYLLSLI